MMTKRKLIIGVSLKVVILSLIIMILNTAVNTIGVSISNDLAIEQLQNSDMPFYFMQLWNVFVQFIGICELIFVAVFGGFIISDFYRYFKTKNEVE